MSTYFRPKHFMNLSSTLQTDPNDANQVWPVNRKSNDVEQQAKKKGAMEWQFPEEQHSNGTCQHINKSSPSTTSGKHDP